MKLLSNQVLDPYPSRIDGEINRFAWGLEVNNGERERELLFYFGRARMSRSQKRDVGDEKDGYKYPLSPNDHLSRGSAVA